MTEESFFKEFRNLFKRHFLNKSKQEKSIDDSMKVGSPMRDSEEISDQKKREKIHELCQLLIKQQELITSGRLQFIGLNKIKRRLGKSWEGIKPIVYETVEDVIKENLDRRDLFLRYQEDCYILIFSETSLELAEIKATLIAEEIRRRMFEKERHEWEEVHIKREVREAKAALLKDSQSIEDTVEKIYSDQNISKLKASEGVSYSDEQKKKAREIATQVKEEAQKKNAEGINDPEHEGIDVHMIEVEAYKKNLQKQMPENTGPILDCIYAPILNTRHMVMTTYLYVIKTDNSDIYPFREHKALYRNFQHSKKVQYDLSVLKGVIDELKEMEKDGRKLLLCCPVHYRTLARLSSFQEYEIICRSIPDDMHKYLFFLIFDLPEAIHRGSLSAFVQPLKKFCRYVCAEVPFSPNVDFESYRVSGVDSVGIDLGSEVFDENTKTNILRKLNAFSQNAKKKYIPFVFVLGLADIKLVTSAIVAKYDFVGGAAVHTHVKKPSNVYRFKYEDVYRKALQSNKN